MFCEKNLQLKVYGKALYFEEEVEGWMFIISLIITQFGQFDESVTSHSIEFTASCVGFGQSVENCFNVRNGSFAMIFEEIIEWMLGTQVTSEGQAIDGANEVNSSEMNLPLTEHVRCQFGFTFDQRPNVLLTWRCVNLGCWNNKRIEIDKFDFVHNKVLKAINRFFSLKASICTWIHL